MRNIEYGRSRSVDDYRASSRAALSSYENTSYLSCLGRARARQPPSAVRQQFTLYSIIEKVEIALSNDPSTTDFSGNTSLSRDVGVRLGRSPV